MSYGDYGGRYVPETLIPALDELEAGWREASEDPSFAEELDRQAHAARPSRPRGSHNKRIVRRSEGPPHPVLHYSSCPGLPPGCDQVRLGSALPG